MKEEGGSQESLVRDRPAHKNLGRCRARVENMEARRMDQALRRSKIRIDVGLERKGK